MVGAVGGAGGVSGMGEIGGVGESYEVVEWTYIKHQISCPALSISPSPTSPTLLCTSPATYLLPTSSISLTLHLTHYYLKVKS
ncbi:MAG: hypothetical protein AAF827_11820 [Cyanobacteria bacterium P01_D01_bin.6]